MDVLCPNSNYVKVPCTVLFSGPTNCGKTQLVLDLIENEYRNHFDNIIIICSTLRWNKTYQTRSWLWSDNYVFLIEPRDKLFEWISTLTKLFAGEETLFVIDDMIADETLDKKRQPLLDLAISGRHRNHSVWLLTQSYTAIPKNLRRQKKMLFFWYPDDRSDLQKVDEETNLMEDWGSIKDQLKTKKYACLYIRLEHPRDYKVISD